MLDRLLKLSLSGLERFTFHFMLVKRTVKLIGTTKLKKKEEQQDPCYEYNTYFEL